MPTPDDIDIHDPDRQGVNFQLGNGRKVHVCLRKGILRVTCSGQLVVLPDASNLLKIGVQE